MRDGYSIGKALHRDGLLICHMVFNRPYTVRPDMALRMVDVVLYEYALTF